MDAEYKLSDRSASFFEWGDKNVPHSFMFTRDLLDVDNLLQLKSSKLMFLRFGDCECLNIRTFFDIFNLASVFNTYDKFTQFLVGFDIYKNYFSPVTGKKRYNSEVFNCLLDVVVGFEMTEFDIIMGCDDKIKNFIDKLFSNEKINIRFVDTCIYKLLGNEIYPTINVDDAADCYGVLCDRNYHGSMIDVFMDKFSNKLKETKRKTGFSGRKINLAGYRPDQSLEEIIGLLSFFGIEVNMLFLPEVDITSLDSFYDASLSVLFPLEDYEVIYDKIDMKRIYIEQPYGFKKSLLWVKSIADFFGILIEENEKWKNYYNKRILIWNNLVARSRQFKIGFIIGECDVESLTNENKFPEGIGVLNIVEEMGFSLELLIITAMGSYCRMKKKLMSQLRYPARHVVDLLRDPKMVEDYIDKSDCHCFYSDIYHDQKIILNGKNNFSFFLFEKGFDGAIRSLGKLLKLCGMNFFREYQRNNSSSAKPIEL